MQPDYPFRKRSLFYIGTVLIIGVLGFGLLHASSHYSAQSAKGDKLITIGGLSIVLLVIFIIPFLSFAAKYWKLKSEGRPLPAADAATHELSVQFTDGHFRIIPSRGILNWVNSDKTVKLTDNNRQQPTVIFETPFKDIQMFDVELGSIRIQTHEKMYSCTPLGSPILPPSAGGLRGVAVLGTLIIDTKLVASAGIPELADRLRAEGVKVRYNQINTKFEYSFDWAFGVLFAGVMILGIFIVH